MGDLTKEEAGVALVLVVAGLVGFMALAAILDGWAFTILWRWFVVPVFGLPALRVSQAIGLGLVFGLATHQYIPADKSDKWGRFTYIWSAPLLSVLIGWFVRLFA